ncbi:MAG: serine/threonine protein kinase, partial [Lachnospiraceae bacterium]|nr:serine/threonine protein kinase [Lachnospiraceae bacterium]
MEGYLFDRYEIIKEIGGGGFGRVFLAHDHHLNKAVAVKKMRAGKTTGKEALILRQLKHEGLPTVFDYRSLKDEAYLIMEYVDGTTLRRMLDRDGKLPAGEALSVTLKILEILGYLHEQNPRIIYRDLKPSNIMLLPDGGVRLVDLGAALLK